MNPQLEELACLYVLDRLEPAEHAAFEERLLREPSLASLVRDLESAMAERILALPQHAPPPNLLARIERRLGVRAAPASDRGPAWFPLVGWGIAAVIALSLGTLAIQSLRPAPTAGRPIIIVVGLDSQRSTLTELTLADRPLTPDARFVQLAALAEKYWETPDALPVPVSTAGPSGRGYAVFDPGSNQGFIAIRQLPAERPDRRYHLWVGDSGSGQVRHAGMLPTAVAAGGLYFFSMPPSPDAPAAPPAFFVTAEDPAAPVSGQPHGQVVLGNRRI